jgi:hypothetical protein
MRGDESNLAVKFNSFILNHLKVVHRPVNGEKVETDRPSRADYVLI